MTLEEIFSEISAHMIKGLMVHDQMARYYCFLNLKSYEECHKNHYLCESKNYSDLNCYFCSHHEKLIKEKPVSDPKIIPTAWYSYQKRDVDATTKRNAVKTGLEKWIEWEQETLDLYSKMYKELLEIGEVLDAAYILKLIKEVDKELVNATSFYLDKKSCDFNINNIINEQKGELF